jgi:hypothetical protein
MGFSKYKWLSVSLGVLSLVVIWALRGAQLDHAQLPEWRSEIWQTWLWRQIVGIFKEGKFADTVALWSAIAAIFSAMAAFSANARVRDREKLERPRVLIEGVRWKPLEEGPHAGQLLLAIRNSGKFDATEVILWVSFEASAPGGREIAPRTPYRKDAIAPDRSQIKLDIPRETWAKVCNTEELVEVTIVLKYHAAVVGANDAEAYVGILDITRDLKTKEVRKVEVIDRHNPDVHRRVPPAKEFAVPNPTFNA